MRERQRQKRIIVIVGMALGLVVLSIIGGVIFDQWWQPSRPVAQVNDTTLTQGEYWTQQRYQLAQQITSSIQLQLLLGDQFAGQGGPAPADLNNAVPAIRGSPVNDQAVAIWIDQQLIATGANELGIDATDTEVAQQLVTEVGPAFPSEVITDTDSITPTEVLTDTSELTETDSVTETESTSGDTESETTTAAAAEEELGPTATPFPTPTPLPPDEALAEQNALIQRIYDRYVEQLFGFDANLNLEDFEAGLQQQYQQRVLTTKIQESLVPEDTFEATTEPSSITAQHILIAVDIPEEATEEEQEEAFAERQSDAEAVLEQLDEGVEFANLVVEFSEDQATRESGGTLPSFDSEGATIDGSQIDPAILEAALALEENEVSELVRTSFGWHIIQVTNRVVDTPEAQVQRARTEAFEEWIEEQRTEQTIQRFPPQTPVPTPESIEEVPDEDIPLPTAVLNGPAPEPITDTEGLEDTESLTDTLPQEEEVVGPGPEQSPDETALPEADTEGNTTPETVEDTETDETDTEESEATPTATP
ncbi:MAG: peptidylprolyl isomerase [Chloroflexota bacterium]